jgi:predicted MFS family arabinose efflux permease
MLWSVYFSDALGAEVVSAAWILLMLFAMLGLYLANRPRMKKVSHRKAMVVGCASTAICVFAATMFENGWVALLIFGLHEVGRSIFDLRRKVYVHDHVPSDKRATIVSFGSMVIHFGAAIGWLVTGFLADKIGIAACWQISAAVMLVAALFAFKLPWRGN